MKMPKTTHVSVCVRINGVPLMFLLDTGATHSCITKNVAKQLKLPVIATTKISSLLGLTRMKVVRARTIQLSKGVLRNFPLWVRPQLIKFDGLLGMDILIKYRITIDFQKKKLRLTKFGRRRK